MSPTLFQADLRITNHKRHNFPLSLTLLSFKTRIERPPVLTATASFSSVFFQLLQYSRQHPSFSVSQGYSDDKKRLEFFGSSQFNSAFAVSFHSTRSEYGSQVRQWRDFPHNPLLRIASNEIASLFIDNRLRQTSKCGKNISDTLGSPRVPLFCSYHILTSSVIYY